MKKETLNKMLFDSFTAIKNSKEDINDYNDVIEHYLGLGASFKESASSKGVLLIHQFFNNPKMLDYLYKKDSSLAFFVKDGINPLEHALKHQNDLNYDSVDLHLKYNNKLSAKGVLSLTSALYDVVLLVLEKADFDGTALKSLMNAEAFRSVVKCDKRIMERTGELFREKNETAFGLSLDTLLYFSGEIINLNAADDKGRTILHSHAERVFNYMEEHEKEEKFYIKKEKEILKKASNRYHHEMNYLKMTSKGWADNDDNVNSYAWVETLNGYSNLMDEVDKVIEKRLEEHLPNNTKEEIALLVRQDLLSLNEIFSKTDANFHQEDNSGVSVLDILNKTWKKYTNEKAGYFKALPVKQQHELKLSVETLLASKSSVYRTTFKI